MLYKSIRKDQRLITILSRYSTETNTGIIAASLPCLKPIFKSMLRSTAGYYGSSGKNNGGRSGVTGATSGGGSSGYKLRTYTGSNPHGRGSQFLRSATSSHATASVAHHGSAFPSSRTTIDPLADNSSEESILVNKVMGMSGINEAGSRHITKTTVVTVDRTDLDLEMGGGGGGNGRGDGPGSNSDRMWAARVHDIEPERRVEDRL